MIAVQSLYGSSNAHRIMGTSCDQLARVQHIRMSAVLSLQPLSKMLALLLNFGFRHHGDLQT